MNIIELKPVIKRVIGKQTRTILTKVLSDGQNLMLTDLETFITLKGFDLPKGLLDPQALGITNQISSLDIYDFPDFAEISKKNEKTRFRN